jgi:hypothetical protein
MKKYFNIALLAAVAVSTFSLSSCKNEVDDIFNQDAIARIDAERDRYVDLLTSDGGKWQMEYFATDHEKGYVFVMTFNTNGTVTVSGMNEWQSYNFPEITNRTVAYASDVSMWDVITDSGPVLTFNTFNRVLHVFSDPADIPSEGEEEEVETGYGHEGDYEFQLMKYSGDTLYVEGKKYGVKMIMTRLAQDTNDKEFLTQVYNNFQNIYTAKIPRTYMILPDGTKWNVYYNATESSLNMFRFDRDSIATAESHNMIITHDGMSFMTPHTFNGVTKDAQGNENAYTVQRFTLQEDGSLIHVDAQGNRTILIADALADVIMNQYYYWQVNNLTDDLGGKYKDMISEISAEMKTSGFTATLNYLQFNYSAANKAFTLTFSAKWPAAGVTYIPEFYYTAERVSDTQIKLVKLPKGNDQAEQFAKECRTLKQLVEDLDGATFDLKANSVLAPIHMTMSEQGNAANFMIWHLIR